MTNTSRLTYTAPLDILPYLLLLDDYYALSLLSAAHNFFVLVL